MKIFPALALAGATMMTLAACASGGQSKVSTPSLPPSGVVAVPSTSVAPSSSGPKLNARGMMVKALGEEAGFGPDKAHAVIRFAIDSIAPVTCDDTYGSSQATNGHLVGAHMRLSTAAAGADLNNAPSSINPAQFSFVGSNGITVPGSVITSAVTYSCLKPAEQFPSGQFAPGSNYVGTLVFDLPEEHGALMYTPGFSNGSGWEWDF